MNIELKPIAESKVRQLGGEVFGVLVRTEDSEVMAVSEHGRCTRLDAPVMGPEPIIPSERFTVEPHGSGYAIYRGRDADHHGENLGHVTECMPCLPRMLERALNAQERPEYNVDREFLVQLLTDRQKRIDELEKQVAEAARAQGGQGAELDEYQKFDQELCREVFEKLNAEFDKDPKGGITVYTEDWCASVHHLKRLPRQNIGTIGYVNTQPQPAVPEGFALIPLLGGEPEITNEMKAEFMGEFSWQEYAPYNDEDGDFHDYTATRTVPWSLCKTIYKRMAGFVMLSTPTTPQADGWISMADREPTKSDEDCEGRIWLLWPDRRYFERVIRGHVSCSPEFCWMPTGLKRPQPPAGQSESKCCCGETEDAWRLCPEHGPAAGQEDA